MNTVDLITNLPHPLFTGLIILAPFSMRELLRVRSTVGFMKLIIYYDLLYLIYYEEVFPHMSPFIKSVIPPPPPSPTFLSTL